MGMTNWIPRLMTMSYYSSLHEPYYLTPEFGTCNFLN